MNRSLLTLLLLGLGGCVASVSATSGPPGGSFRAFNTMEVLPVSDRAETMIVLSKPLAGPRDFWCAAGDYAHRYFRTPPADRIYILEGPGPSPVSRARNAVTFTTRPNPGMEGGPRPGDGGNYSLRIDEPGFNVQAGQARSFCTKSRRRFTGAGFF